MFRSVLIANRGEIAVRIAATLRRMGIRSVVVCSFPDRTGLAVRMADAHVLLEGTSAAETYLDIDSVIAAAVESGCDAIHPGYGFLSENAAFAERCAEAGLTFIGPSAEVLRSVGDKAAARRFAVANDVPVVPGWDGSDEDAVLVEQASRVGFPIMIKARGGGGGRGMREVHSPDELIEAISSARREAESTFGDPGLLLEQLVTDGHHVEVQILADSHGAIVHLGERDCSVQRRHQKLIEETPSPVVDADLRARLTGAALRLAGAIGYVNAGTFEFLVGPPGNGVSRPFYFLEVNPRLQVEHPVTEMVTGLDLVELQVRVAAGEPLPFAQDDVAFTGHAIECRINAEDPFSGFAPNSGRLARCDAFADRFDRGYRGGDTVPAMYDSLLGKLVVTAPDRNQAIAAALAELDGLEVAPLRTTARLQAAVLESDAFRSGAATIDWLERELPRLIVAAQTPDAWWAAAVAASVEQSGSGWRERPFGQAAWVGAGHRTLWLDDGAMRRQVSLVSARDDCGVVSLDGMTYQYETSNDGVRIGAQVFSATRTQRHRVLVSSPEGEPEHDRWFNIVSPPPLPRRTATVTAGSAVIAAPLAGTIAAVRVVTDDLVEAGQVVALLDAMKMEHRITAPSPGRVAAIHVSVGEVVAEGALLIELG
ncbi:MAG TPA: biotin carboxylase N-terminal domain-containing protein [Tepidiformaceae bacterium]|nr:biotin carboxylase N-terminal domain-containing protein [Tepidiformaceae bacterium]